MRGHRAGSLFQAGVVASIMVATTVVTTVVGARPVAAAQSVSCTTRTAVSIAPDANVVVIGDSLTVGEWCVSRSAAADYNSRGLIARVDARVGRFTSTGLTLLRAEGASLPTNVVFALGTNDLTAGSSVADVRTRLEAAIGIAGEDRNVFFVTVYSGRQAAQSTAYNLAMFSLAQSYPNVTVIDWAARLRSMPGLLATDGIHLNTTGYRARSAFVASAIAEVASVPPRPLTTTSPLGVPVGFSPLVPDRLADSREGLRLTILRAGVVQRLQVAAVGSVPAEAKAVAVNVTATETSGPGFLTAYPCGPVPEVSSLNWPGAGWTVANSSIVPMDAAGGLCLRSIADTHVVVDVTGYFSEPGADLFNPITPVRLGDTRTGPVPRDGAALRFAVAGVGAVPVGATAVSLNVAVVDPGGPGFATVYPCGSPLPPPTSTVNVMPGVRVQSNNAIVPVGDGAVCVYSSRPADVVVDVTGWFGSTGSRLQPVVPIRLLDTRVGDPLLSGGMTRRPVASGQSVVMSVAGVRGVPSGSMAVSVNITAVGHQVDGFVAAHPSTAPWSGTSSVNTHGGMVDSNGSQTALGGGGLTLLTSAQGHLVVDLSGVWL